MRIRGLDPTDPPRFALLVLRDAANRFQRHRCTTAAAAIAFHVLFSIFPMLLLVAGIVGSRLRDPEVRAEITQGLLTALPLDPDAADQVDRLLLTASGNLAAIGILSGVALIWSASGVLGSIRGAMELAWEGHHGTRPFLHGKLVDVLVLAIVLIVILSSFFAGLLISVLPQVSLDAIAEGGTAGRVIDVIQAWTGSIVTVATSSAFLLLAYKLLPRPRPRLVYAAAGALIGGLLLELARWGFGLYVANVARFDVVYGSIGSVIAFLLFVYIASIITLVGAETGASIRRVHRNWAALGRARRAAAGA